mgnify:FL=1
MANGFDFGMPAGLAYRHNFQQDIQNRSMLQQMRRQKKIDQENDARMWANELETISVQNPHDAAGLENFLDGHFKKMGKWIQENPNFRTQPEEYVYWQKNFVKPIKDNEWVRADMNFQQQKKLYSQYVSKYGEGHPKTQKMGQEMRNYRITGNTDGFRDQGRKEFFFSAPYDGFDPMQTIAGYYSKLQPSGQSSTQDGVNRFYNATYDEKKSLASQMIADPNFAGMWDEWWGNMSDSEKRADNVIDHIIKVGSPFVKPRVTALPRPTTTTGGSGDTKSTNWDLFTRDVYIPLSKEAIGGKQFPLRQADPIAMNDILKNADDTITIPEDAQMIYRAGSGNNQKILPMGALLTGKRKATATGLTTLRNINGRDQIMNEVEVFVSANELLDREKEFSELWGKNNLIPEGVDDDVLDVGLFGGQLGRIDEMDDVTIEENYGSIFSKVEDPENPGQILGFNVKTYIPYNMQDLRPRMQYQSKLYGKVKGETATQYPTAGGRVVNTADGPMVQIIDENTGQVKYQPL